MPKIAAISKIDFPYKVNQEEVKEYVKQLFPPEMAHVQKMSDVFNNTGINARSFCRPLSYYTTSSGFEENNNTYTQYASDYSVKAAEKCLSLARISKSDITDIIYVSSTGLATPSIDVLLINRLKLNPNINRTPIFGLGCAGGVSGIAKANMMAKANPKAVVLFIAVELCSLTFLRHDLSKSNFVASSLFSDGVAACIIIGDEYKCKSQATISIAASQSKLYYDSLDVMGWEFTDAGFRVLFSRGIPEIIKKNVKNDITSFLDEQELSFPDIKNFIFHPGGKKVIDAYIASLNINDGFLKNTRQIMSNYGNMSSVTVLYVLEKFLTDGFENGYGLMLALGPGFSCEMVLLSMKKN